MGLLERVLQLGGCLYTETPVERVDTIGPDEIKLVTTRGICVTKKIVYAVNGYSAGILPQFHNVIIPVRGQAAHLATNQDAHHGFHPVTTYNLFYDGTHVDYLNPRPDGTVVLGGGGRNFRHGSDDRNDRWWDTVDDSVLISPAVKSDFDRTMETYFRGWEKSEARVDMTWTGSKCNFRCVAGVY
jgi:glycine/D-amino acid oxidase-like deaminating enzyme